MSKSVSIGSTMYAHGTFDFITSASNGEFKIAMGASDTRELTSGRYYYDILVSSGTTTYKIVDGNICGTTRYFFCSHNFKAVIKWHSHHLDKI